MEPALVESNPARTARRIRKLEEYVRCNLLYNERFICKHHQDCRASAPPYFYEGQMSHVGKHYDLRVGGQELRIVVVGQEYGQQLTGVDLEGQRRKARRAQDRPLAPATEDPGASHTATGGKA